jgi:hypothetical protein
MRKYFLVAIYIFCFAFGVMAQEDKPVCPSISLSGPEGLTRVGEEITVKAIVSPNNYSDIKYSWSVDKGRIYSGQNSPEVVIATDEIQPGPKPTNLEVRLAIANLPPSCQSAARAQYPVYIIVDFFPIDEYVAKSFNDEKPRLDNLAVQLMHDPAMKAYVVKSFKAGTPKREISRQIERAKRFLFVTRKYPMDRFVILIDPTGEDREHTKLWLWPANEDFPCGDCKPY